MTAHDLARLLLVGPNGLVGICSAPGVTNWLQGVSDICKGSIPCDGVETPAVVILCTEETINDDEGGSWS